MVSADSRVKRRCLGSSRADTTPARRDRAVTWPRQGVGFSVLSPPTTAHAKVTGSLRHQIDDFVIPGPAVLGVQPRAPVRSAAPSAASSSRPPDSAPAGAAADGAGAGALDGAADPEAAGADPEAAGAEPELADRAGARNAGVPLLPADASATRHALTSTL